MVIRTDFLLSDDLAGAACSVYLWGSQTIEDRWDTPIPSVVWYGGWRPKAIWVWSNHHISVKDGCLASLKILPYNLLLGATITPPSVLCLLCRCFLVNFHRLRDGMRNWRPYCILRSCDGGPVIYLSFYWKTGDRSFHFQSADDYCARTCNLNSGRKDIFAGPSESNSDDWGAVPPMGCSDEYY